MAWGKKSGCNYQRGNGEMGLVRSTSFGRKRVALPSNNDVMEIRCFDKTPTKRQCSSEHSFFTSDKSVLEALPQDVLIRILCGVEHDDLKRLFFVSKSIREATLIAKQWHFAYSTPKKTLGFPNAIDLENLGDPKKTLGFPNAIDLENLGEFNEIEQAPKQVRIPRARLSSKKLADISVALFTSAGEENWPRRELFVAMETEI